MPETILFYGVRDAYGFMSNFYHAPMIDANGHEWATVEHAFQAMKTLDMDERETIRKTAKPGEAKGLGRHVDLRPGWDDMRIDVMHRLVLAKFQQNPQLADKLLATGDAVLVENAPRDYFWGCGADGSGRNELGKALMSVREQLRARV